MKKHAPLPNEMVLSYLAIRQAVGWLGLFLPVGVSVIAYIFGCHQLQDSISHYFYTVSGSLFVGTLCAVGLFLFTYKGFDKWDQWASNLASVFAFGIAFSPCNMSPACLRCDVLCYLDNPYRNTIHYCCAAGLFITLALMSLILFTRTDQARPGAKKLARNRIYRICGLIMLGAMAGILSLKIPMVHQALGRTAMFWLEWITLWAFGISWLVKGELVLKD